LTIGSGGPANNDKGKVEGLIGWIRRPMRRELRRKPLSLMLDCEPVSAGNLASVPATDHPGHNSRRERWGISYYVIFEPYADAFAPVVARLAEG
jgi:hypothetical protein